jgi:transporter family protein
MTLDTLPSWLFWALLSAAFAALTAIFAKVGVEGINSAAIFVRSSSVRSRWSRLSTS